MKKLILAAALAVVASNAQAREQIQIVGSSTVYPFATIVAEKFGQAGNNKTPVIESTGTGGGMKLFCAGIGTQHPDITNASRAIKSKEKAMCEKNGITPIEFAVGNDGVAFAQNNTSTPMHIGIEHIAAALGEVSLSDDILEEEGPSEETSTATPDVATLGNIVG